MTNRPRRLAIFRAPSTPRGAQHHMVTLIADFLSDPGVEVIHLHGTGR
ncbi:MAG: hypothetical protein WEA77_04675 [Hyphomonas sp.]